MHANVVVAQAAADPMTSPMGVPAGGGDEPRGTMGGPAPAALDAAVAAVLPSATALRHDLHRHPEPGFEEIRTLGRIREALKGIGLEGGTVLAGTGFIVDIEGTGPVAPAATDGSPRPRCIALRADMDALRMTEGNEGLPYRSTTDEAAHMCGHDGHMAALVGAATLLMQARDRLPQGTRVRLLFQPAEEGPGGAAPMIQAGCLEGVDEVRGTARWRHGAERRD